MAITRKLTSSQIVLLRRLARGIVACSRNRRTAEALVRLGLASRSDRSDDAYTITEAGRIVERLI